MNKLRLKQLIWFGFAGVVGYLVEISIINFAVGFGFGAILPRLVSLPTAILVTYHINKKYSFKSKRRAVPYQKTKYFFGMVLGAALNFLIYCVFIYVNFGPSISQ